MHSERDGSPVTDSADPVTETQESGQPEDWPAVVDRAYRLILGRPGDPDGVAHFVTALGSGGATVADVCASLASSAEFAQRLEPDPEPEPDAEQDAPEAGDDEVAEPDPDLIDVAEMIANVTLEELSERAEGYFRAVAEPDVLLTKPFREVGDAADLLTTFGQVLRGLRPYPGMRVLDFGAGTCWTSRYLTRLGCRVVALDVSPTALDLGRRLFAEQPVPGAHHEPEFLVFDGRRIDLPDASVDRILSFDAFHHVPNPAEVLQEMARVLRPGGIAAFAEPGDRHSIQPQSQYEMRHYGVIENDVVIEDVWEWARDAGFVDLRLCPVDTAPSWVDIPTFRAVVAGGEEGDHFVALTRAAIDGRRMFVLRVAGEQAPDSREQQGLTAGLAVDDVALTAAGDTTVLTGTCRIRNTGSRVWLPAATGFGGVSLGVRLRQADLTTRDLERLALSDSPIEPGEEVALPVRVEIPTGPERPVSVEFDLVSERVCWFSLNGSPVVRLPLTP
ncbi:methyltransferase domain-containing protein [Actinosynnema sp. NPDC047251]|uniref:Uncharacterized protein n=1 Tax=Saccharothrix espanaensis (strain ATCC 51144 / DSM 44229 / JCM 9112 / NBRC 15066 / NRRL 15764) TaxID=1179773 RepID=K0JW49_SACES|nr:methyltransferase domain-containing protein [Saccharothrix espanaensis]CCH32050.1 hypothetical protein BN6_47750 [Saccharothrix espanaensis DSM 44229]